MPASFFKHFIFMFTHFMRIFNLKTSIKVDLVNLFCLAKAKQKKTNRLQARSNVNLLTDKRV